MHNKEWLEKRPQLHTNAKDVRRGFNPPNGKFDVKLRVKLDHVLKVNEIPKDPIKL